MPAAWRCRPAGAQVVIIADPRWTPRATAAAGGRCRRRRGRGSSSQSVPATAFPKPIPRSVRARWEARPQPTFALAKPAPCRRRAQPSCAPGLRADAGGGGLRLAQRSRGLVSVFVEDGAVVALDWGRTEGTVAGEGLDAARTFSATRRRVDQPASCPASRRPVPLLRLEWGCNPGGEHRDLRRLRPNLGTGPRHRPRLRGEPDPDHHPRHRWSPREQEGLGGYSGGEGLNRVVFMLASLIIRTRFVHRRSSRRSRQLFDCPAAPSRCGR